VAVPMPSSFVTRPAVLWNSSGPHGNFVQSPGRAGLFLLSNDRLDVAMASGADGVHLGQGDMPGQYGPAARCP